jgi:hypothetical protein
MAFINWLKKFAHFLFKYCWVINELSGFFWERERGGGGELKVLDNGGAYYLFVSTYIYIKKKWKCESRINF